MKSQAGRFIASIVFATTLLLATYSCKKEQGTGTTITGEIKLEVTVHHHAWGVPYMPVYLKKNTNQFPGHDTARYEIKGSTDNDGSVTFNGLHPGDYYLYASGYDLVWGDTVIGYKPVSLTFGNLANNTFTTELAVSE
jgi:hypothetical protein